MPGTARAAKTIDELPANFSSIEKLQEFWDTHSSADYEHLMQPVDVMVKLSSSKAYCPIAKELMRKLRKRAREEGVSAATLVNLWLQEKLSA